MELAEGEHGMIVERPGHPRRAAADAAALPRPARLLLRDLERRRDSPRPAFPGRSCRTTTRVSTERGVVRGLHCQIGPNAQGKLVRVRARRDLGRGGGHPARLADLWAACRRGAERGELAAALGAGRLPARLLHARAGYRGDLQGHRAVRPAGRARRDLERSGAGGALADRPGRGDAVGQGRLLPRLAECERLVHAADMDGRPILVTGGTGQLASALAAAAARADRPASAGRSSISTGPTASRPRSATRRRGWW